MTALRDEFQRELERSIQRIRDALAPYARLVRSERERTQQFASDLGASLADVGVLRRRIGELGEAER